MRNLFLSTVNKCTITVIIIIINVKSFLERHFCSSFLERHFCGITITFLKINVLLWQKAVLHVTTLILCKARQVLRDLFNTNQGNDSDITFVAGATKINFKIWKPKDLNYIPREERFEPLTNSGRSLSWAYKQALKLSSHISATTQLKNTCDHMVVYIPVLLPMQQFYITTMIMLTFSVIVMCQYLYSMCLVSRVLKDTYFKEQAWVITSKHRICDTENNT